MYIYSSIVLITEARRAQASMMHDVAWHGLRIGRIPWGGETFCIVLMRCDAMSGYGMGMAWHGTILQFIKFTEPQIQQTIDRRLFALIDVFGEFVLCSLNIFHVNYLRISSSLLIFSVHISMSLLLCLPTQSLDNTQLTLSLYPCRI